MKSSSKWAERQIHFCRSSPSKLVEKKQTPQLCGRLRGPAADWWKQNWTWCQSHWLKTGWTHVYLRVLSIKQWEKNNDISSVKKMHEILNKNIKVCVWRWSGFIFYGWPEKWISCRSGRIWSVRTVSLFATVRGSVPMVGSIQWKLNFLHFRFHTFSLGRIFRNQQPGSDGGPLRSGQPGVGCHQLPQRCQPGAEHRLQPQPGGELRRPLD